MEPGLTPTLFSSIKVEGVELAEANCRKAVGSWLSLHEVKRGGIAVM